MSQPDSLKIPLRGADEAYALFGPHDQFLGIIEQHTDAKIMTRNEEIWITGTSKQQHILEQLFDALLGYIRRGIPLTQQKVTYALQLAQKGQIKELTRLIDDPIALTVKGSSIEVRTIGQRQYMDAILHHDIVFAEGPAGTGKTFLAVTLAVLAIKQEKVKRIVLTRPAVEAGESLGFLPGDLQEKVDPYLRPLYDSLYTLLGVEQVTKMMERGTIEVAPLAYMRGRTLDDSFVILDEAQNTTHEQMKMFLTRLGFGSQMVITGDITQVDLPRGKKSGLQVAKEVLRDVSEIPFIVLTETDVVRHPLVQKVVRAYRENEEKSL